MPEICIIAGPNGAGKTTASLRFLPRDMAIYEYVNLDEIARGLNPLKPETANSMAARFAIERMRSLSRRRLSFGFETTLSGTTHARFIRSRIDEGYTITLSFLSLPSPDLAVTRVANRVKQGGHFIPKEEIIRRYYRDLSNLMKIYLPLCNRGIIYNSAQPSELMTVIAEKKTNNDITIFDKKLWQNLLERAEDEK
jgi:predicted ABC-type ATPase